MKDDNIKEFYPGCGGDNKDNNDADTVVGDSNTVFAVVSYSMR